MAEQLLDRLGATDVTYRNNTALVLWGFACFFMLGVALMTYVIFRDGVAGHSAPFVATTLMTFWLGGLGLSAFAFGRPRLSITIQPAGILVAKRYPFSTDSRRVPHEQVKPATVVTTTDDEGSPYFICRVEIASGETFDIAEGHSREHCEHVSSMFNQALAKFSGMTK